MAEEGLEFVRKPFETEDAPVLESQQRAMGSTSFWDANPILLSTDAAGVRARRVLDALIEEDLRELEASALDAVKG